MFCKAYISVNNVKEDVTLLKYLLSIHNTRGVGGSVDERQEKVKARPKQVKERSKHRKHNLNHNYNLMGFDTIEINLV